MMLNLSSAVCCYHKWYLSYYSVTCDAVSVFTPMCTLQHHVLPPANDVACLNTERFDQIDTSTSDRELLTGVK